MRCFRPSYPSETALPSVHSPLVIQALTSVISPATWWCESHKARAALAKSALRSRSRAAARRLAPALRRRLAAADLSHACSLRAGVRAGAPALWAAARADAPGRHRCSVAMSRRGVWQLTKLTVNYCAHSGSSRGVRCEQRAAPRRAPNPALTLPCAAASLWAATWRRSAAATRRWRWRRRCGPGGTRTRWRSTVRGRCVRARVGALALSLLPLRLTSCTPACRAAQPMGTCAPWT
jgi:hypothetical protein